MAPMGRIRAIRDVELYRALLGADRPVDSGRRGHRPAAPAGGGGVDVGAGLYPFPSCWTPGARYDNKPRRWQHLDTISSRLGSRPTCRGSTAAAMESARCGCPGADPGSKFTALFERLAIDLLRECSIAG